MKDPVRLLDGGASELERALLHAGAAEEPPADGPARVAAALGLALGAGAAASAASTAAAHSSVAPAAAASAATGSAAGPGAGLGLGLAAKWSWLAVSAAVLGAAAWGAATLSTSPAPTPTPTPSLSPTPTPSLSPTPIPSLSPTPQRAPAPARSDSDPRSSSAPEAKSIAGEIAALDRARRGLSRGDTLSALAELDRYANEHPRGVLRQEAQLLRVEALWAAGRRAQARALARGFARAHPGSPHLERIRALIGGE